MKPILFLFLLLMNLLAIAQKEKHQLSLSLNPTISNRFVYIKDFGVMKYAEYNKAYSFNENKYNSRLDIGANIEYKYTIMQNYACGIGLGWSSISQSETEIFNSTTILKEVVRSNFLDIPLFIQYKLQNEKLKNLHFTLGTTCYYLIKQKYVFTDNNNKYVSKINFKKILKNNEIDKLFWGYDIGFGIDLINSKTGKFVIEPTYSIMKHEKQLFSIQNYYSMYRIEIKYFFQRFNKK